MNLHLAQKHDICNEDYRKRIMTTNILPKQRINVEQEEEKMKHRYTIGSWRQCFFEQFTKISYIIRTKSTSNRFEKEFEKYKIAKKQFIEKLPELLQTDRGKYVAIANGDLRIGEDKQALRNLIIQEHGHVSMYIGKISEQKRIIKRRPKLIRK